MKARALVAAVLALAGAPIVVAGEPEGASPVRFGIDAQSLPAQLAAGFVPDYASIWIGPWTQVQGWGMPDAQLDQMRQNGVTPVIHFYYWGDDISQACIETGCWSDLHGVYKDQGGWQVVAQQLVDHLEQIMGGEPVVVMLETEFNKADVGAYEPLDALLAQKAAFVRNQYPAAEIVMPLGNWGQSMWSTWDQFAAASDYVGLQAMVAWTRQSPPAYAAIFDQTLAGAQKLQAAFGRPVMLTDLALSSYPEPIYLDAQAFTLGKFFDGLPRLKAAGVEVILYRSWFDDPNMDAKNTFGEAERSWGLASATQNKPSATVWLDGVAAERANPAPAPDCGDESLNPLPPPPTGTPITGSSNAHAAPAPTAVINGEANGLTITLDATSSWDPAGLPVTYQWDMGDGTTGVGAITTHTYAGPGSYAISLTVSNGNHDATAVANANAEVPNTPPAAAFTVEANGGTISVDAGPSWDSDGDALVYNWDFGDGCSGSGEAATRSYEWDGTYRIGLTVSDGTDTATAFQDVTVDGGNLPPIADFSFVNAAQPVYFGAWASVDPDGDQLSYWWDFGDGNTGIGLDHAHMYDAPGTYQVTLAASDGHYAPTITKAVTVGDVPVTLVASFFPTSASNEWWIDVSPVSTSPLAAINVTINGGPPAPLVKNPWGTWSISRHAPAGSTVVFEATSIYGATTTSRAMTWLPSITPPTFTANFTPSNSVNEWWIDVAVASETAIQGVEAIVDGGPSRWLTANPWGSWSGSFHVPRGTPMVFRATSALSGTATSEPMGWLDHLPPPTFPAEFVTSASINEWWMDVAVVTAEALVAVNATINNATTIELSPSTWGTWSATSHVARDSLVQFTATSSTGATATSQAITWMEGFPPPSFPATFAPSGSINEWWIDVAIQSAATIVGADAFVNNGTAIPLTPTAWGTWAASTPVPRDSSVVFKANSSEGAVATSEPITWMEGFPPPTFPATFTPAESITEWWIDVAVASPDAVTTVEASINNGTPIALAPTTWSSWAASASVPRDATVVFKATSSTGAVATSEPIIWMEGFPPPTFPAKFSPADTIGEWWIDVAVNTTAAVVAVEASVNNGSAVHLTPTDWNTWSGATAVPRGSSVVFTATSSTGAVAVGDPITWMEDIPPPTFLAKFSTADTINEWWIDVAVNTTATVVAVEASVDGGPAIHLSPTEWNTWSGAATIPRGTPVVFTATANTGAIAVGPAIHWMEDDGPATFPAKFSPADTINEWWIDVAVNTTATVVAVQAVVNDGPIVHLTPTEWHTWSRATAVPRGASVVFTATSSNGEVAVGKPIIWMEESD